MQTLGRANDLPRHGVGGALGKGVNADFKGGRGGFGFGHEGKNYIGQTNVTNAQFASLVTKAVNMVILLT